MSPTPSVNDWSRWFSQWLERHPVKEPPEDLRQRYAKEVMARIREPQGRSPIFQWGPQLRFAPRLGFALATAACVLLVFLVLQRPPRPTGLLEQGRISLAQVVEELEADLELLEQLESDPLLVEGEADSEEGWLEELRRLDEWELEAG